MIPRRLGVLAALAALLVALLQAQDPPKPRDPRAELKERMKERYALLDQLRDAGKLGETIAGEVRLVKQSYESDKADPKDPTKGTVGELATAENTDRIALYELLAKELKVTAQEVAKQNGLRNLDKAKPDHWIQVKSEWVQRKTIKTIVEDDKGGGDKGKEGDKEKKEPGR
jgi:uncharacterized protein YdbL (DUF1318 family)